MSKIGQKLIQVPTGVTFESESNVVTVKGQAGQISFTLPKGISALKENDTISIKRSSDEKKLKSLHGLYRSLIANAVLGLVKPWQETLEIVGTGYNVKQQGEELIVKLGFSHPVVVKKTEGISLSVEGNNK